MFVCLKGAPIASKVPLAPGGISWNRKPWNINSLCSPTKCFRVDPCWTPWEICWNNNCQQLPWLVSDSIVASKCFFFYGYPPEVEQLAPEKLPGPNRRVVFQPPFFRGYVKLRGSSQFSIFFPCYGPSKLSTLMVEHWTGIIGNLTHTLVGFLNV